MPTNTILKLNIKNIDFTLLFPQLVPSAGGEPCVKHEFLFS